MSNKVNNKNKDHLEKTLNQEYVLYLTKQIEYWSNTEETYRKLSESKDLSSDERAWHAETAAKANLAKRVLESALKHHKEGATGNKDE